MFSIVSPLTSPVFIYVNNEAKREKLMHSGLITWLSLLPECPVITPLRKLKKSWAVYHPPGCLFFFSPGQSELTCSINIHNMWLPAPTVKTRAPSRISGEVPRVHIHSSTKPDTKTTGACFIGRFLPVDFQSESPSLCAAQRSHTRV